MRYPSAGRTKIRASALLSQLSNLGFSSNLPLRGNKKTRLKTGFFYSGGEGGIRTLDEC